MLGLLALLSATRAELAPHRLVVDRRACSSSAPLFVEPNARVAVEWGFTCNDGNGGCRGERPAAAWRLTLADERGGGVVHRSNGTASIPAGVLLPDRAYTLTVHHAGGRSASCRIHAALAPAAVWAGADWIGGGTQLRSTFAARAAPTRATLYASGLGCFSLTLNGESVTGASTHKVDSSMMDPGWSTIPNMRLLYTAYRVDVKAGANVLGVRLGFCHYGYIDQAFCVSGHAERDACRAFTMVLSLSFADGTSQNITSTPASWSATTAANPMTYSHLYHGETFDGSMVEPGWDSDPSFKLSPMWHAATSYAANSTAYEGPRNGELSLMTMPPMGAAEERAAVSIKKLELLQSSAGQLISYASSDHSKPMVEAKGGYFLGTVAPTANVTSEAACKQLCKQNEKCVQVTWRVQSGGDQQCESYTAIKSSLQPTSPSDVRGWIFPASPAGCPAGPTAKGVKYPPGCAWYVIRGKKHFVADCLTPLPGWPCGSKACHSAVTSVPLQLATSAALAAIPVGTNFTCGLMPQSCPSPFATNVTTHVYDFGQNFAGITKLTIKAPKGTRILIRHSEFLQTCGDVISQQCKAAKPDAKSPTCGAAMQKGGWPCITTPLGPDALDQSQGGNQGNQTTLYVAAGTGVEVFSPSFSYYGFRYASISGLPEGFEPDKTTLTALRVNTLAESHGNVNFSSKTTTGRTLNKIQNAVRYTFQSNVHSHPEDCPQRERHGWTADSQVSSAAQLLNFNLDSFYSNWERSMHDVQLLGCDVKAASPCPPRKAGCAACPCLPDPLLADPRGLPRTKTTPPSKVRPPWFSCSAEWTPSGNASGAISDVVPWGGWPGGFPADPNWGLAVTTIPWEVWTRTGRLDILHEHYGAAKAYVEFLTRNAPGGHWKNESSTLYLQASTGDWLCCDQLPKCGDESTDGRCNHNCPKAAASAFAHLLGVSRVADMAAAIGNSADAKRFAAQLETMKTAYHQQFFVAASKLYADVSGVPGQFSSTEIQSLQVFPLYLELVPAQYKRGVVAGLAANINAHGNHTNCGIIGARFLLEVLAANGHEELAFTLATQTSCPSWGYMVEGAGEPFASHETPGTIWETWQDLHGISVSKNHPALASSIGLFVFTLAGLSSDSDKRQLVLRPLPVAVRRLGSASVESGMRGGVRFSWSSNQLRFKAEVSLQPGVAAKLHILLPIASTGEHIVLSESRAGGSIVWSSDPAATEAELVNGVLSAKLSDDRTELIVELLGGAYSFEASRRGSGENLLLASGRGSFKSDDSEPAAGETVRFAPSAAAVRNPMRGFRHQIDGMCGSLNSHGHYVDPTGKEAVAAGLKVMENLTISVSLGYCYLSRWWNVSLPDAMLQNLDDRLDEFRAAGASVLCNFAYEDGKENYDNDVEPYTYERIYAHLAQLTPVLTKNADVVYGLQSGLVGNAGEWAHDTRCLLKNASGLQQMVAAELYGVLKAMPDRPVLIRKGQEKAHLLLGEPLYSEDTGPDGHKICSGALSATGGKASSLPPQFQYGVVDTTSAFKQVAYARLGHYNAVRDSCRESLELFLLLTVALQGFMSTKGDGGTFSPSDARSPWFAYFSREAPFVAVDGECYYGTPWPAKKRLLVEGHHAALRMVEHSYNTFSHHNSFYPLDTEDTNCTLCDHGTNKSINVMQHTPLNVSFLKAHLLPITHAYAKHAAANKDNVDGSVYRYLHDHIGYRLELVSAVATADSASIKLALVIQNQGFSSGQNVRAWHLALLQAGEVVWQALATQQPLADWRKLYPHVPGDPLRRMTNHSVTLGAAVHRKLPAGSYDVGFALVDPHAPTSSAAVAALQAVRFTNALAFEAGGYNVVGKIKLKTDARSARSASQSPR